MIDASSVFGVTAGCRLARVCAPRPWASEVAHVLCFVSLDSSWSYGWLKLGGRVLCPLLGLHSAAVEAWCR